MAYSRTYYQANRKRILAARVADPEKHRAYLSYQRAYRKANPYDPADGLKQKHGITMGAWWELYRLQDGRCYLCGNPLPADPSKVHLDHDHRCCPPRRSCQYCRRGLACLPCNMLIGHAGDDPDRLRRVADNLAAANAQVKIRGDQLALFAIPPQRNGNHDD
jgi:hypothetical protein